MLGKNRGLKYFNIAQPSITRLDLHLFRFIYCALLVWIHIDRQNFYLRSMIETTRFHPIPLFAWMGIGRFSLETFDWIYLALIFFLLLAALGLLTRISLLCSTILFFLIHGQLLSLTKLPDSPYVYHSENLVVFTLLILAFDSNIGQNSLFTKWWSLIRRDKNQVISSHSLNLIIIAMGFVYFGASYVRLVINGLSWMDGFSLKSYFMMSYFSDGIELAYTLAQHHYVCMVLSVAVTVFELGFLLVFFFKRSYLVLLTGSLLFHGTILMIMNINFFSYHGFALATYLFLPPFSLGRRLSEKLSSRKGCPDEAL
jgi:hypothetical protein